jgi:tetratricopeptide (TPR) repeat protein
LGWLGAAAQADGDLLTSMDFHRRAKVRAGNSPTLARSHVPLTLYLLGENNEAAETGHEALEQVRLLNHTSGTLYSLSHLGLALAGTGRYREALNIFDEARRFGREHEAWSFLARAIAMSAGFHLDVFDFAGNEALAEEARELARSVSFAPPVVSAGIDLLLNFARRAEISRAERLLPEVLQAMQTVGGWHLWLWRTRLAQAQAELALAQNKWSEAVRLADEAIAQSSSRRRVKYELLGLWTKARALLGLGKEKESISDLQTARDKARLFGDPAMTLRLDAALLPLAGSEVLALETSTSLQQIRAALPEGEMRNRFEQAEPVCLIKKMAGPAPKVTGR